MADTTIRQDMLDLAADLREIPTDPFDVRQTQVFVVTRVWSGGQKGAPAAPNQPRYTDTEMELLPRPKVRPLTQREIASSGGRYDDGDLIVKYIQPMPPTEPGGITTAQMLQDHVPQGTEIFYRLAGAINGNYNRRSSNIAPALHYELVIGQRRDSPAKT